MSIRDLLVLDHYCIAVPANQFEHLKPICNVLPGASHKVVQSGESSWEGLYLTSRTGSYLEILRGRTSESFAAGFSPYRPMSIDARRIRAELPELPWSAGTMLTQNREPWFDWLSVGSCDPLVDPIGAWIMHYHPVHREDIHPIVPSSSDAFTELDFEVNPELVSKISGLNAWLPIRLSREGDVLKCSILDRDGYPSEVRFRLNSSVESLRIQSIRFRLFAPMSNSSIDLGDFVLRLEDRNAALVRKG